MAEGGVSSPSYLRNCSICFEVFKQPKLLACFHTFCASCLEKYIDRTASGNTFYCPLCRTNIQMPKTGVAGFQTNFYIESTCEDQKNEGAVLCDVCGNKRSADHRCLDCEENFCSQCTEVHLNMKVSRHHKLMELNAADESVKRKIKSRVFCNKHGKKEVEVICKDCDKLLCVLCMLTEHQGHKSREVTAEANEVRRELRSEVDGPSTKAAIEKQDRLTAELKGQNRELRRLLQMEQGNVEQQRKKLQNAVYEIVKKIEETVAKEFNDALTKNDQKITELEATGNYLRSLATNADHILKHGNTVDVINKGRDICARISRERENVLDNKEVLSNIISIPTLREGSVNVDKLIKMIGTVESTRPPFSLNRKNFNKVSHFKLQGGKRYVYGISRINNKRCWIPTSNPKETSIIGRPVRNSLRHRVGLCYSLPRGPRLKTGNSQRTD